MPSCNSKSDSSGTRGGWYASVSNDPTGEKVVCSNKAPAPTMSYETTCYGQTCDATIASNDVGWCLCSDSSVHYLSNDHPVTTCNDVCANAPSEFLLMGAWDEAFLKCSSVKDWSAAACQGGNKGKALSRVVMIMVAAAVVLAIGSILFTSPSRKHLTQLTELKGKTKRGM